MRPPNLLTVLVLLALRIWSVVANEGFSFSEEVVEQFWKAKEEILANTDENDLIICVGNSASFIYWTFLESDNRQVLLAPVSGRYYMQDLYSQENIWHLGYQAGPSREQVEWYYKSVLKEPLLKMGYFDRIVLVDYSDSGLSVDAFARLLRENARNIKSDCRGKVPEEDGLAMAFIRLAHSLPYEDLEGWVELPQSVDTMLEVRAIDDDIVTAMVSDIAPRLAISYKVQNWQKSGVKKMQEDWTQQPESQTLIEQLLKGHARDRVKSWLIPSYRLQKVGATHKTHRKPRAAEDK